MSADDQLRTDASGASGVPATVGPKAAADDAALQTNMSDEGAADSKAARTKAAHGKPSKGETARAQDAAAGTRRLSPCGPGCPWPDMNSPPILSV